MSTILLILGTVIFASFLFDLIVFFQYDIHKSMTIDHTDKWDYGTFEQFQEQFKGRAWERHGWPDSLFDESTDSEIHASIIKFNGKGMVLYKWDWLKFKRFKNRYINVESAKYVPGIWKKNG